MSRWLKNVNNLLEKLDSTAETVVEERRTGGAGDDGDDDDLTGVGSSIDDILAKRGLDTDDEEDGEVMVTARGEELSADGAASSAWGDDADIFVDASESAEPDKRDNNDDESSMNMIDKKVAAAPASAISQLSMDQSVEKDTLVQHQEESHTDDDKNAPISPAAPNTSSSLTQPRDEKAKSPPQSTASVPPDTPLPKQQLTYEDTPSATTVFSTPLRSPPASSKPKVTMPSSATTPGGQQVPMVAKKELMDAQKESRTLRRHVVSLNSQLETAESELSAQRAELERAADRMEKDRRRQKEEREKVQKQHAEELKTLKTQQDLALKDMQKRMDEQMATYRSQLSEIENRRRQEGGDMNKELAQALEREQQMIEKVNMME
jgi:hypothetical protein